MNSRIVMVHITTQSTVSYSHGLASLAGVILADPGIKDEVVLVTVRDDSLDESVEKILSVNPYIVLFTATSNQWKRANSLAHKLKDLNPDLMLCVGGSHPTAVPRPTEETSFDVCVPGEAEDVIGLLVRAAREVGTARDQLLNASQKRKVIENLDDLPMPHFSMFCREDILTYPSVMFSRGCPFHCSYCMSGLRGRAGKPRWKSAERAIREVLHIVQTYDPDEIYIDDDTLLKKPDWVFKFCELYRQHIEVPFYCNSRPEVLTTQLARCLHEANCAAVGIGIESGSRRIRYDILRREIPDEVILRAFDIVHKEGIETWSFNMVGIPTETPEDLIATIKLNELAQTEYVRSSIFTPYPGTPIFELYGSGTCNCNKSYIRTDNDLPEEMRKIYKDWITMLQQEKRLWYTREEETLVD